MWQGREVAIENPAYALILRRELIVRVAREFLEVAVINEVPKPTSFVRGFLGYEENFDPLTATWLSLQSEFERVELENELAIAVAQFDTTCV